MTQTPPPPSGQQPWSGQGSTEPGHGPQQPHPPTSPQGGYEPPPGHAAGASQDYGAPGAHGRTFTPVDGEERTMMLLAHLSAPISFLLSGAWLPFLGPLLIWLFYKDKSQAVRTASAGAFNFNISMTIASIALWISVILTLGVGFLWAIPLWIVLFIIQVWAHVKGAIRASNGEIYEYPFQIRILS